ncbi:flagellar biosynthetic protein FliO [Ramlibacter humi]|uniref:Flagellar biosynthesis protein FliO n=1 Tax=Ramlibacter humi TaxID=2530451 RepID=A0A4Z0BF36_9BURK|nr:flagellar biosynthetic protein FliO [Ramlibacter humi]TFY97073.1 hypothetical protein EZ216_19635 [Ramlibacter humi]
MGAVLRSTVLAVACAGLLLAWPLASLSQPAASPVGAASAEAPGPLPKDLPLRRDAGGPADNPPWLALFVLAGLAIGAAVFVVRRRGARGLLQAWAAPRSGVAVERVASQPLTPQASVHVVRWRGEELLLGCTGSQVTLLARHPAESGEGQSS